MNSPQMARKLSEQPDFLQKKTKVNIYNTSKKVNEKKTYCWHTCLIYPQDHMRPGYMEYQMTQGQISRLLGGLVS